MVELAMEQPSQLPKSVRACCQDFDNLKEIPSGKKDLILKYCSQCGSKHYELIAEKGTFEFSLKGLN